MKKAFNFRSVIICALVLILCLSAFVACDKDKDGQNNNLANFENAKSQVYNLYKSLNNTSQTADIYLYSTLVREDGTYTITWTYTVTAGPAENISVVESDKENMIKFHVNTEATEATTVVIKGVIKDSHGNQANVAENGFTVTIPKCEYASFEEYVAMCKENGGSVSETSKTCAVRGFVIGVNGNGSSMGSVWIMDSNGNGYYAYKPKYQNGENATRESLNEYLPIGTEVIVRGTPMLAFNSTLEFNKDCTIEKTGKTAEDKGVTLDYLDVTEAWGNATSINDTALEKYQARRVELKNIVMGEKKDNDFYFTVNGVEFIFRSNIYLMTIEESNALAAKWVVGGKANIKGIVNVYSSKYQVYPDSVNSIEVLTQTDAEVVAGIKASLKLEESYKADFTLPTSTLATINWTVSGAGAVIGENNAVTITRTDEEQTVVFTASIVKGEATDTATFTVKIPANEVVDPNTVILTTESLGLVKEKYQESPEAGVTVNGVTFSFEEIGFYDAGIQTRNKNGKASKIWNTTATNKPIAKLIVKLYDGKAGFNNNDTHTITFGNAVNGNAYSTTLSTVKDQYEYEIIPDAATYTFFTFAHNASYTYTSFFESITVVYVDEVVKTDQELVDEAKEALTLATTTTGVSFTLPTTGINGTTITWTSNNEAVIAINGENAVVTAPAAETVVTLTATIKLNEATATKTFDVTVTVTIPEFNVTINQPADGGTLAVTINDEAFTGGKVQQGKTLVIVPTAVDANHELVAILVNGTKLDAVEGVYSVTVNDAEVTITATFREIKYATVTVGTVDNGTLDVKVGDVAVESDKQYRDGTVLTITANPASDDYKLVGIKVNGTAITGTTYTIAETDTEVVITATFAEKYPAMSIADFKASETAANTQVKLTGVATAIDTKAVYIQDADGQAVYVYYGNGNVPAGFVIGKEYTFTGKKAEYKGLIQLASPTKVDEKDTETVITAKVINDQAGYDALTVANSSELVTINGLVVKNGNWMIGDTVVAHWEGNALSGDSAAVKAIVALLNDGVSFKLVNVNVSVNNNKLQVIVLKAEQVVIDWVPVATVDLKEIGVNGTAKITVTANPAVTTDVKATFVTENDQIATVDANGVVTGVAVGTVGINVTANGHTVKVEITVVAVAEEFTVNYTKTVDGANGSIASVMAGETAVEPGTKVLKGTKVTVTVTPAEGYRLASYTLNGGDAVAANGETSFDVTVTGDVTIVVTFEVKPAAKTWQKVTDASTLAVGDQVIFVNESAKAEALAQSGKFLSVQTYTDAPTGALVFTLAAGSADGTFAFTTKDGKYLTTSAAKTMYINGTAINDNSSWTIAFKTDGNAVITNKAGFGTIQYNSNNPRFLNYTSNTGVMQLYKLA